MVATGAGECDLLEHPLLERLRAKFDGAQHDRWAAIAPLEAREELLPLVRHEVLRVPVGLEDAAHLPDHVGIAGARDADVPLEARRLRGVREV